MGYVNGLGFKEQCGNERGLELHLSSQFYPPHPKYVVESTIEGFKKYWNGEIDEYELIECCYLRDIDGLYRYYGMFLEETHSDGEFSYDG